MTTTYTIRLRNGDAAEWVADNPVLSDGEPGVESDTNKFKLGDGTTAWNDLPYAGADPVLIQAMIDATAEETLEAAQAYTDGHVFLRTTVVKTTASLATLAQELGSVTLPIGYRLLKIVTNYPARVRLYTSSAKQTADAARAVTTDPTGDHGVVLDVVTTASVLSLHLSPTVDGYDPNSDGSIPITIDNLDTVSRAVTATLTYVRTE